MLAPKTQQQASLSILCKVPNAEGGSMRSSQDVSYLQKPQSTGMNREKPSRGPGKPGVQGNSCFDESLPEERCQQQRRWDDTAGGPPTCLLPWMPLRRSKQGGVEALQAHTTTGAANLMRTRGVCRASHGLAPPLRVGSAPSHQDCLYVSIHRISSILQIPCTPI